MTYKGFNEAAFMEYMENRFNGFENSFLRQLVENLIAYAHEHEHVSKDQFVYFVSDMIPEVEFGEIAMFMDDECLTVEGVKMKYRWMVEGV